MKSFFSWIGELCMELGELVTGSKFFTITLDIIAEAYYTILDVLGNSLRYIAFILRVVLPYFMWYIGIYLYEQRGEFAVGGEIFVPLIVFIITYYIKQYANRLGKGERIPIPDKRFTELGEEDGEYTVETKRLEEMIIYMSNLEDWLQRKGLLK